ncbi:MAG TPA: MarR family transcriptional regulator [Steroidobacteraceae bacterium]|nr:MarR family transcriptional regulator [Steroidobacteraceae bacterium]
MADKNQADLYLDHSPGVGFLLNKAQVLYRARLLKAIEGHGIQIGHVQVLFALHKLLAPDNSALTQTRLGKLTGIEKSSLVLLLDDMEKRGWVQRQAHPSDRRAYVIGVTPAGTRRHATISKLLQTEEQQALSFLTKSQRAVFTSFLTELIQHLDAGV